MRKFTIHVSAGRGAPEVPCGIYEAQSPEEAIGMAKRENSELAAVELDASEYELTWTAEENFFA